MLGQVANTDVNLKTESGEILNSSSRCLCSVMKHCMFELEVFLIELVWSFNFIGTETRALEEV